MAAPDTIPRSGWRLGARRYLVVLVAVNVAVVTALAVFLYLLYRTDEDRSRRLIEYHLGTSNQAQLAIKEIALLQRDVAIGDDPESTVNDRLNTLYLSHRAIMSLQNRYSGERFEQLAARVDQAFNRLHAALPVNDLTNREPEKVDLAMTDLALRLEQLSRLHIAAHYDIVHGSRDLLNLDTQILLILFVALISFGGVLNAAIVRRFETATTERANAVAAKRQSDARLDAFFESAPAALAIVNSELRFEKANPVIGRMNGKPKLSRLGERVEDCLPEETAATVCNAMRRSFETGESISNVALRLPSANRSGAGQNWIYSQFPIPGDKDETPSLGVVITDVTELKETEDTLRVERNLTSAILDTANALVVVLDREGHIVRFNRACELLTGYAAVDMLESFVWDRLLRDEDVEPVKQVFARLTEHKAPGEFESAWLTRDGAARMISWNNSVIADESGDVEFVVSVGIDITERRAVSDRLARAAENLSTAQRIAQLGSWEWDKAANSETWSDQIYRNLGLEPGSCAASSRNFLDCMHPDDRKPLLEEFSQAVKEKRPFNIDIRVVWPNGGERIMRERGEPVIGENGAVVGMSGTTQDITEQKLAEAKLSRVAENLAKAQRIACLGSWVWDVNSGALDWSDEIYRMLGAEPGSIEVSFDTFRKAVHPDDWPAVEQAINRSLEDGSPYSVEHRMVRLDGSERIIHESGEVEFDSDNKPCLMRGTAQDITAQRATEQAMRDSEARLNAFFAEAPVGLGIIDHERRYVTLNETLARSNGLPVADHIGKTPSELFPEEMAAMIESVMDRTLVGGEHIINEEASATSPDGSTRFWAFSQFPLPATDKAKGALGVAAVDITELKQVQQKLAVLAHSLAEAQRIGQIGSWELDPSSGALTWSEENYRLLGLDPETFTPTYDTLLEMIHPDDRERMVVRNDLAKTDGIVEPIEYRLIRPDGETRVLQSRGEIVQNDDDTILLRGTVQDITEQKRIEEELASLNSRLEARVEERTAELRAAQEELIKSERLATLGQLTATVSHELRNPLGAMRTSMYIVEKIADSDDERLARSIERVNRSITRCDNIIDELLDFTRIQSLEPAETCLDRWLGRLLDELEVPEGVEVKRKFGAPDTVVMADVDRLRRAVINVYENACHALSAAIDRRPARRNVRITVETRVRKDRFEIAVSDTGGGIPDDVLPKIFEPLYSTKNFGVGLGLPTVKQIMEQHGGGVIVASKGGGARFVLWLPLVFELAATQ